MLTYFKIHLFEYNLKACDDMAKGLIKSLSEAPLSVQLKTKAFGQLKKSSFVSGIYELILL